MFILTHLTFVLTDNLSSFQLKSDDAKTCIVGHLEDLGRHYGTVMDLIKK